MCGISGFISKNKQISGKDFYNAHYLIKHRGPDDEGFISSENNKINFYKGHDSIAAFDNLKQVDSIGKSGFFMGHRRLSILDLTYHGHQPMCDETKRFFISYNGEIYNFKELKKELINKGYTFKSNCDTEVVLKSYIEWGTECFNKFNGMWALAIYDNKTKNVMLSRDRFGIKPLFYHLDNNSLIFSSEIKTIRQLLNNNLTLNKRTALKYINNCFINNSKSTFWNEINELEPGHFLIYENEHIKIKKYWNFNPKTVNYNDNDALEQFSYLFEDSVRLRMISDVEVGSLLSGGLDSNTIIGTINKLGFIKNKSFNTFSALFNYKNFDETHYINEVINLLDLNSFNFSPDPVEMINIIDKVLFYIEEPFRSLQVISQYLLYDLIKKSSNVKVVLNGQGADEIFAGYTKDYFTFFIHLIKHFRYIKLLKEIKLFMNNRNKKVGNILTLNFIKRMIFSTFDMNYFNNTKYSEVIKKPLREYLKYDDRNSMAFGIEARVPFLDHRIVEFAFSLKPEYKINNFTNKLIEREYAKNMVPDSIINRKDKLGFANPHEIWQRKELKHCFDKVFSDIKSKGLYGLINPHKITVLYNNYLDGKHTDKTYLLWRIFFFYKW